MPHLEPLPSIDEIVGETATPSITDRFADVMGWLRLEYDLTPDVLAAAEDVLDVLKGWKETG
jgi:hypothetical protein